MSSLPLPAPWGRWTLAALVVVAFTTASSSQTVSLSKTSVAFGNVPIGFTSSTAVVTLTNTGTAALSIGSIVAPTPFVETNTCGPSVNAGAHCNISVTFSPTTVTASSGSVTITDNASDSPQTITLSGTGVVPVRLLPLNLSFGITPLGTTSAVIAVTLTNYLPSAITISGITTTGDFAQTNTCSSVGSNKACTIDVTFTPAAGGERRGTLTVTDNANTSPQTAALAGSGSASGATSIAISPINLTLPAGATEQYIAMGTFPGGGTYDVTQSANWSSSKTGIATITNTADAKGVASALTAGSTTIKAALGVLSSSTSLTVGSAVVSLAVSPSNPAVTLGGTQQFVATGTLSNGTQQNLTNSVTWSSSAPAIATINSTGLASSIAAGTTTISATLGSVTGSTSLGVNAAGLVTIAVTPASSSVPLGVQQHYKAVGTYTDGSTQDVTTAVLWSSSAATVASISNVAGSQGLASGLAVGSTTITATLGSVSGSTGLTVTSATLVSLAVTPSAPSIALDVTQQFTATGTFSDSSTRNLTTSVTWSSSVGTVATISNAAGSQGLATALNTGIAAITATSGSISGSASLTVTTATLKSIAIAPQNAVIGLAASQPFTATGSYSDGTMQDLTVTVVWASSVPGVAVISNAAGSQGLATSVGTGSSLITATLGAQSAQTTLTVTAATLVSIAVNPSDAAVPVGGTQQFAAIGTFSDNSQQDLSTQATWSSTNPAVAKIVAGGLATGLAPGSTTVQAALTLSGSAALTVLPTTPAPPTGVSTIAGNMQVTVNWSASLGAIGYSVARSTTSGGPYTAVGNAISNSFSDIGLANNATYYYVVAAVGSLGTSAYSSEVSATPEQALGGAFTTFTASWNGLARLYVVYVPPVLQSHPAMIMALHGADIADPSSPPLTVCHNMGWDALADAHGFLVICPIATWKPGGHHPGAFFWESYNTDTYFPIAPDDSGFLRSLMLAMLKPPSSGGFSVDPARIFVMGMSSGAMMTHRACIDNADLVAACAPVSGMVWLGSPSPPLPNPSRPVPIIRFQGDADPTISYCGGLLSEGSEGLIPYPPVDTDIDYWLAADGLGPNPTPLCSGGQPTDVFDLDFKSSDGKIEVEFVRELGYAHVYKQWVSAAIWEFFSTHGR